MLRSVYNTLTKLLNQNHMNLLDQIASKHLGKAGDGTVVKPYVTLLKVDPSLLVAIPRHLNRTAYNIVSGEPASIGYDVWNCYEVSYLLSNGFPVSCYVRIMYESTSESIVESKSIKLYLNSFNMNRVDSLSVNDSIEQVRQRIIDDLTPVLGVAPVVGVMLAYRDPVPADVEFWPVMEAMVDYQQMTFDDFNESSELLVPSNQHVLRVRTSSLRSNCRVTNQPDWADVYIKIVGENVPTIESMLKYIVSMRNENHFHEEICECIYKRLYDKFAPTDLFVACFYTRRGGIDINPIRYSSKEFFEQEFSNFLSTDVIYKTVRQ